MVSSFTLAATVLSLAASTLAQALTINSPTGITTCEPTSLIWSGGAAPYYLSIIPGGEPNGAVIENLGTQSGTTYSWMVDLPAGSNITFAIKDTSGALAYSGASVVAAGSTTSCAKSTSVVAGGAAASGTGAAATSTGAAAGTSAAAAGSSKSATSPAAAGASSSKAASTTSSAQTVVVSSLLAVLGLGASLVL